MSADGPSEGAALGAGTWVSDRPNKEGEGGSGVSGVGSKGFGVASRNEVGGALKSPVGFQEGCTTGGGPESTEGHLHPEWGRGRWGHSAEDWPSPHCPTVEETPSRDRGLPLVL